MSSNSITTSLCTEADFPAVTSVIMEVLGGGMFFDLIFPGHYEPISQARYAAEFFAQSQLDSTHRWVKAVDNSTGEVVGASQWEIYDDRSKMPRDDTLVGPPGPGYLASWLNGSEGKAFKGRDEEKELAEILATGLVSYRRKKLRESKGPVICLSFMAVSKKHQRRGIGQELMKWGMKVADEMKAECVVEASAKGRGLYEKFGFITEESGDLKVPEKWAHKDKMTLWMMYRPIQQAATAA